jgi:hypothetical protein
MGYSGTWVENENRFAIRVGRCTVSVWEGSDRAAVDNSTQSLPSGSVISKGGSLCVHPQFFSQVLGGGYSLEKGNLVKIISPPQYLAAAGFIVPVEER